MVSEDIIRISSDELELPWLDMWSISCCWEGKGSVSTVGAGFDFRNWEISSRQGHSFEKWSPPHSRQGYFAFLFPLSLSLLVGLGFSSWFSGFLFLFLPFFLLLEVWVLWIELTSVENLGFKGVGVAVWGCLEGFTADEDWIEPTIPSTGTSADGLAGLVLGRGAWGIKS